MHPRLNELLEHIDRHHQALLVVVERIPVPLLGELNLYQWLAFIGMHESRHALQVAEIGDALRDRAGVA